MGNMKVIKKGHNPKLIPLRGTCPRCGAVIEALPTELEYTSDQREGDYYSCKCPDCKESTVYFTEPKLSENYWHK